MSLRIIADVEQESRYRDEYRVTFQVNDMSRQYRLSRIYPASYYKCIFDRVFDDMCEAIKDEIYQPEPQECPSIKTPGN
jgi:hypothetical protein